jgi:hypothetical protein
MGRNISFNGYNLQTDHIFTEEIDDSGMPQRALTVLTLAHANASKIPYDEWPSRTVSISGYVIGDSITDLDTRMDALKGALIGVDKYLDIDYGNGTRRYTATVQKFDAPRPGGLLYASFDIDFICTRPFGQDATPTVYCDYRQRQLLSNGSFDTNSTGWSAFNAATVARQTTAGNLLSGAGSLQVTTTGTGVNASQGAQFTAYTSTIGTTYTLSSYVKGTASQTAHIRLSESGGTTDNTLVLDGTWQRISVTRTATTTSLTPLLLIDGANTSVKVAYFDNVLLEVGNSPTNYGDSAPRTLGSYSDTFTFAGTAPWQQPIITLTIVSGTLGSGQISVGNNTNGQAIIITRTWTAGEILIIDCYNKVITVGGVEIDFSGAFPEFSPGTGVVGVGHNLTSMTFNYNVTCAAQYM